MSENSENPVDFTTIEPWNSRDFPIKINSIRYNQDFSLLTLGTSKGYKIFSTSNLREVHEPSEEVTKLDDINIALCYYKSSLVFMLPTKYNKNYTNKEIIVFDDFSQIKLASFKVKTEEILELFISKNVIFLITLYNIIVLEIFSFKVIDIIYSINPMNQVISFNYNDYIAYTELKEKQKVFVKYYINENNKIINQAKKVINFNFDYLQTIQLSPSGKVLAVVSIYGNKIHLYYTENGELKECLLISQYMETILKVAFSEKKSNYILVLKIDYKFKVYKIGKEQEKNSICICHKYDDNNITAQNLNENNSGIFGYFKKYSKNKDIKDTHAYGEFEGNFLFFDFDRNKNKDIILIDQKGQFIKYHFKKKGAGHILPILSFQWE